jgi:drug/metabolite transporter (DMT)-like permease
VLNLDLLRSLRHRTGVALALGALYLIWGASYLMTSVALRSVPPFVALALRFGLAGSLLLLWVCWRSPAPFAGLPLPRTVGAGLLLLVGSSGLSVWAQQTVPSGVTALVLAAVPVVVLIVDWLLFSGRVPDARSLAGAAAGIAGIGMVVAHLNALSGAIRPLSVAALLCSTLCWSFGTLVSRGSIGPRQVMAATCVQMLAASFVHAMISLASGEWADFHPATVSTASWLALLYMAVASSLVGILCYLWLLTQLSPQKVTTYALVNPIVALLLGSLLLGERVTPLVLAAIVLVLAGVGMVLWPGARARAARS